MIANNRRVAFFLLGSLGAIAAATLDGSAQAAPPKVIVTPSTASIGPNRTVQFSATVAGKPGIGVTWLVNGIRGGAPALGLISPTGLFTAPASCRRGCK